MLAASWIMSLVCAKWLIRRRSVLKGCTFVVFPFCCRHGEARRRDRLFSREFNIKKPKELVIESHYQLILQVSGVRLVPYCLLLFTVHLGAALLLALIYQASAHHSSGRAALISMHRSAFINLDVSTTEPHARSQLQLKNSLRARR